METKEIEFLKGISNVEYPNFGITNLIDEITKDGDTNMHLDYECEDGSGKCQAVNTSQINIFGFKRKNIYYACNQYFYFRKIFTKFAEITLVNVDDFSEEKMFLGKHRDKVFIGTTPKESIARAVLNSEGAYAVKNRFLKRLQESPTLTVHEYCKWHTMLTGSCKDGSDDFVKSVGLNKQDKVGMMSFIRITAKDPINGHAIRTIFDDIIKKYPSLLR